MKLIPVTPEQIPLQQPLPFALRTSTGAVLAAKGYVIPTISDLEDLVGLGVCMYIDEDEHPREYLQKLHAMLRADASMGQIASTQITAGDLHKGQRGANAPLPGWLDMLARANALLRDPQPATFQTLLAQLHADIRRHLHRGSDATLMALMQLSATELRSYSAMHAMLVCVMAELAATEILGWSPEHVDITGRVALTMNISMTAMQDELALQTTALTPTQKHMIAVHAAYSAEVLRELGVTDPIWLEAVFHHLDKTPGPLASRSVTLRIARLIQRANLFAAMLAPRASRAPLRPSVARQNCYYDENKAVDEAGAALVKAVGIYSPGTYVRLASEEVALVVRRGASTNAPRVAVLINRQGLATAQPMFRDTSQKDFRITATVAHRDMKVTLPLERLLAMV